MKAKRKPIDVLTPEELGVDVSPRHRILKVEEPVRRQSGVRVADVAQLVEKLRSEAKVI
jgi:electron transfer flavoprotein beta subunit